MAHAAPRSAELQAKLENRVIRRLAVEYDDCNWAYFKDALRRPQLRLTDTTSRLGEWSSEDRAIGVSRSAALDLPWLEVVEILKHEMVHQFVDEVLGGEDRPHGPRFVQACRARGIDPSATHRRDAAADPQPEDRVISRVRKLLALAESSNQHEAELAASTAQRLILKFNLDLDEGPPHDEADFAFAHVGTPSGRVQAHQRRLGRLLIAHFFVRGVWVKHYDPHDDKTGSVLEICGRPENVQLAQFVYDFVSRTIERLWVEHKRERGIRSNRDRRAFLAGAVAGFHGKLDAQRVVHQREGLVWRGDAGVEAYVARRFPRLRSVRYSGGTVNGAYVDGQRAGKEIVLSRPVSAQGGHGRPRALPPKR